jgi:hypothetical protein
MTVPTISLGAALRRCAEVAADEVALIGDDGAAMTYRQWDRRAAALGAALRTRTAIGDTVLARLGDGSDVSIAVALFGALRAGCILLPMSGPGGDVRRAARAHSARLVLTDGLDREVATTGLDSIRIDELEEIDGGSDRQPEGSGGAIVHTAGSTGKPAAVRWTHADLLTWLTGWAGTPERRAHLHAFPPDSGDTLGRVIRTLLRYPGVRGPVADPERLAALMDEHRPVDVLVGAATARELSQRPPSRPAREAVLNLYVTLGVTTGATIAELRRTFRRATVTNVYSVAEAGRGQTWMAYAPLADRADDGDPPPEPSGLSPVGTPIFGGAVRITDDAGRPVPAGSSGRILIRPGLPSSLSYCGGTDRDGVFVDGWVRTGDVGLLDDAGCLHVAGRDPMAPTATESTPAPTKASTPAPTKASTPGPGIIDRAALCWGQQWAWHQQQLPPQSRSPMLVFHRLIPLSPGAGSAEVRRAVALSITRHSSLRTTISPAADTETDTDTDTDPDADGRPQQQVWRDDADRWELREFADRSRCQAWLAEQFDISAAWPLRAALLTTGDDGPSLGIAVHHIATDLHGFNQLCADLRASVDAYLAGAEPALPEVGRHAIDIARYESSPAGELASARAIASWERQAPHMRKVLARMVEGVPAARNGLLIARTTSAAAARRLDAVARGRGRAAVVLGAIAGVLARHLDCEQIPVMVMVTNRNLPGVRHSVCAIAQGGLCVVDARNPDALEPMVASAWSGLLRAQKNGYCDVDALSARMEAVELGRSDLPITVPGVNVLEAGAAEGLGVAPESAERYPAVSVRTLDSLCLGMNFHAAVSDSALTIELRTGVYLATEEQCRELVSKSIRAVLDG